MQRGRFCQHQTRPGETKVEVEDKDKEKDNNTENNLQGKAMMELGSDKNDRSIHKKQSRENEIASQVT